MNVTPVWAASTLLLLIPLTIILPSSIGFTFIHNAYQSHNPRGFRNPNPTFDLGNWHQSQRAEDSSLESSSSTVSSGSSSLWSSESNDDDGFDTEAILKDHNTEGLSHERQGQKKSKYVLGDHGDAAMFWTPSDPVKKSKPITVEHDTTSTNTAPAFKGYDLGNTKNSPVEYRVETNLNSKTIITNNAESQYLSKALWNYGSGNKDTNHVNTTIHEDAHQTGATTDTTPPPPAQYEDIDILIPQTVFDPQNNIDHVWTLLHHEAQREAQREPLLVSFLYSTILNLPNLESVLAFNLANQISSPSMMSTQIMSLIMEALDSSPTFRRDLRSLLASVI